MSLEAIRWALRDAPEVPAQCVGVLVGLADHADKRGCGSYPSARTLAAYARKSERQVRYDLALLAEAKLIRPGDQSLAARLPQNRRPVVYDLAMELGTEAGVQPASPHGVQPTAPHDPPGVQPAALQPAAPPEAADQEELGRGATSFTPWGESLGCNGAQPGVQPTADKPPIKEELSMAGVGEGGSGGEGAARPAKGEPQRKRAVVAHRLPDDFRVTPEMVRWHHEHTPLVDGRRETEKFIDHWTSAGGSNARKRDWVAAWRNWMRKADDELAAATRRNGRRATTDAPAQRSPREEHRNRR